MNSIGVRSFDLLLCRLNKMNRRFLRNLARCLSMDSRFRISEEVREALNSDKGVVALESTLITHGLPAPDNLKYFFKVACRLEQIVRENNCIPATIAIIDNIVHIVLAVADTRKIILFLGLTENQLQYLSFCKNAVKVSTRDLAVAASKVTLFTSIFIVVKFNEKIQNFVGGTTVSATMYAAHRAGISIFATGGLGGVHRDFVERRNLHFMLLNELFITSLCMDVSNDLVELGRIPVAVVSAGIKSILDIPRSLEYLETQGVPVITFGSSNDFPGFYNSKSGHKSPYFFNRAEDIAEIINTSLELGLKHGFLIAAPIPEDNEHHGDVMEEAIKVALREARFNVGQCLMGNVNIHPGGVARNHVDALTKLGINGGLLSVIGDDNNGVLARSLCQHMNFRHVRTIPGEKTASYIGVTAGGSLKIGVLSTNVFRHISPDMVYHTVQKKAFMALHSFSSEGAFCGAVAYIG
uniref:Carbohydrate kinase PfkB domain-containing protein n=1 Tax=Romanomermis culicivorax TaxID=13658 RepID=A0A915JSF3_ROMCU